MNRRKADCSNNNSKNTASQARSGSSRSDHALAPDTCSNEASNRMGSEGNHQIQDLAEAEERMRAAPDLISSVKSWVKVGGRAKMRLKGLERD